MSATLTTGFDFAISYSYLQTALRPSSIARSFDALIYFCAELYNSVLSQMQENPLQTRRLSPAFKGEPIQTVNHWAEEYASAMARAIQIFSVGRDGMDGLIVVSPGGTTGVYVVEELRELRPYREPVQKPDRQIPPPTEIQDSIDGARRMPRWNVKSELL
jgi:hypothetical protein